MREPQDSTGHAIAVGNRVNWRGQIYTIKAFRDGGRLGTRAITFEEPLHVAGEVPDEISVDLVQRIDAPSATAEHVVGCRVHNTGCDGDCDCR